MAQPTSLVFTVRRCRPELVAPANPTPHESKRLSDIDASTGLRAQIPVIQLYGGDSSMGGRDPVRIIREALARALVFYYPFAGRLREVPGSGGGGGLIVDCTGEGVMFIEADADVRLEQFGEPLHPPFPCVEELLYDVPGSGGILHCPLLLIQVTRLMCGGFIFALRLNHTMSDASGLVQFMAAVGEMARGARVPSVQPVWQRELLNARDPPRVTCTHNECIDISDPGDDAVVDMAQRTFLFGPREVSTLRKLVPPNLRHCSTFEVLTACLWRCRTIALRVEPDKKVRFIFPLNARSKFNPPLPAGYYGNVVASAAALSSAGELCRNSFGYVVELVRKAKAAVTEEYMRSLADLLVIRGQAPLSIERSYIVSDVTRAGFGDVDFGWGKAAYGGPAIGEVGGIASFYIPCRNGIVVRICLPAPAMDTFVIELESMLKDDHHQPFANITTFIKSSL